MYYVSVVECSTDVSWLQALNLPSAFMLPRNFLTVYDALSNSWELGQVDLSFLQENDRCLG